MTFRVLIDTCVWLDLAKDPKQHSLLGVIEEMVKQKLISLIVPRIVQVEFHRNRERIAKESAKSLSAHFKLVKDAVVKAGGDQRKAKTVLSHLDDVGHKIPITGGAATQALDRIEKLLTDALPIEAIDAVKIRAAERAINRKAPFHQEKNSMGDALIIETYRECIKDKSAKGHRFIFVTHNKSDFSLQNGNQKLPHRDLADLFSKIKSLYFINLPEALRRVDPSFVTDVMYEYSFTQEPRGLQDILKAEDLMYHQVWYNRHWNWRTKIEDGTIKVVDQETHPRRPSAPETIQRDIWQGALKAAARVERKYGLENLGPWSDFEWGMVNGKLSALRWVLGDEWDMLDT
jgi:hypothetical protein